MLALLATAIVLLALVLIPIACRASDFTETSATKNWLIMTSIVALSVISIVVIMVYLALESLMQ